VAVVIVAAPTNNIIGHANSQIYDSKISIKSTKNFHFEFSY